MQLVWFRRETRKRGEEVLDFGIVAERHKSALAFFPLFFTISSIGSDKDKPEIPDFEILGRIGGGSYGEVYLGRSITGVLRAIKIVRREDFERDKTFEREFEGIVRYEKVSRGHIGLVDVFHVSRNVEEGFYYYVMELADDCESESDDFEIENYEPRTLASELKRRRQHTIDECVEIGYQLAEALGHLHHAGLTHRDVKPSNIIFVNGKPQLADIGLVARTGQRTFVGTEGYVPPEGPGTSSSDLYSLAMVLYEMATGKDRLEFPELPTNMELPVTMNRDEWRALNSVICRAGAPDARKRYETGGAFSAALRNVNSKVEVGASGIGKYVALAGALAAVLAAGGFYAWQQFQPDRDPTDNIDFTQNGDPQTDSESGQNEAEMPPAGEGDESTSGDSSTSDADQTFAGGPVFEPFQFPVQPGVRPDFFGTGIGEDVVISDKDTVHVLPKPDMVEKVPDTPTEPPEPPKKQIARYKVVSNPRGASIWQDGKNIGRTGSFLQFEPGEVELTLKFEGYHDLIVKRVLKEGYNPTELDLELLRDQRPSPPSNWKNSLGIVFEYEPVLEILISEVEIRPEAFSIFNKETGRPEATVSQAGAAYVPENGEMYAFCDWMTERDRKLGFLDNDQYFAPQRSGTDGESATFFCKIDNRFGTVMVNSDPPGAEIFQDGIIIGKTPKQIDHVRIGLVNFELGRPGFERAPVSAEIRTNTLETINVTLKRDASVVFGQPWQGNSLGMKFVPFGDLMASVFETRVSDYDAFLASEPEGITQPRVGFTQTDEHPVAGISANDARAFCKWLTDKDREAGLIQPYHEYRLPTDLEWSAMAGIPDEEGASPDQRDSRILDVYPWGTTWPPPTGAGNFADESAKSELSIVLEGYDDGFSTTAPVGSFEPRENGLHDLSGNVWEWVEEAFRPGSKNMTARGGCWADADQDTFLVSYRNAVAPTIARSNPHGFNVFGFRCVIAEVKP